MDCTFIVVYFGECVLWGIFFLFFFLSADTHSFSLYTVCHEINPFHGDLCIRNVVEWLSSCLSKGFFFVFLFNKKGTVSDPWTDHEGR